MISVVLSLVYKLTYPLPTVFLFRSALAEKKIVLLALQITDFVLLIFLGRCV